MATRFIDAVGVTYGNNIFRKWNLVSNASYISSGGRRGAPYYSFFSGTALRTLPHGTRFIQGCAWAWQNFNAGPMLSVYSNGTSIGQLFVNNDYTISAVFNGTHVGDSAIAVAAPTEWHYYELDLTISNSGGNVAGTATIRVDGNTVLTTGHVTNLTTTNMIDGQATGNQVGIALVGTGSFMDFYCLDDASIDINGNSTTHTAMLGDVEVDALMPDFDVTTNMSTFGGDGTHAYSCVNETPQDDDSSYVFTSNTGNTEEFNHQPITSGTIITAQYVVCARKDSEGLRTFESLVGGSAVKTSEFQGTQNYLSENYYYYCAPLDSDNGTPWTDSVYNAEKFGIVLSQ